MNSLVEIDEQLEEQKRIAVKSVKTELAHVVSLPVESIVEDVIKYASFGKQAVVQAEKAVVSDEASLGLAGDLMKAINAQIKTLEEARKGHTSKMDALKKYVTGLYGAGLTKLDTAKSALQKKMNDWVRAEDARKKKEAREEQLRVEAEALEKAQVQTALGDAQGADQVMEEAAALGAQLSEDVKVSARGVYGSSTSGSKRWVGNVSHAPNFLKWLIDNRPTQVLEALEFRKSYLNKLAKEFGELDQLVPGLGIEEDLSARSR